MMLSLSQSLQCLNRESESEGSGPRGIYGAFYLGAVPRCDLHYRAIEERSSLAMCAFGETVGEEFSSSRDPSQSSAPDSAA